LRVEVETETARGATALGAKAAVDVAITALTARENFMVVLIDGDGKWVDLWT
jgi:hypothetical protein